MFAFCDNYRGNVCMINEIDTGVHDEKCMRKVRAGNVYEEGKGREAR